MITVKNIITSINDLLKKNFPDIERQSTDIRQGFNRPCFYIELDRATSSKVNSKIRDSVISIRIYYFPKDEYNNRIELLDMQGKLEDIFLEGLWVNPSFFMPHFQQDGTDDGLDFITVDGVLQLQFYLYSVQEIEDTTPYEPLENLNTNIKRKG